VKRKEKQVRWLRRAAVLTLLALVLMTYSIFVPRPIPVILAMSAGQAVGTLAFLAYVWAIAGDLLRHLRKRPAEDE